MDRIFLDANVLFSAAYRDGSGLARLWELENVKLITSAYAAEEARVNLTEEGQRARLSNLLEKVQIISRLVALPPAILLPLKDQPILQAALAAKATHLLTGDVHHFGILYGRHVGGVLILPPSEYFMQRTSKRR
ncbi:MAG: PIN domain-containing protein [Candidatus Dormibacteraceae bacterium]